VAGVLLGGVGTPLLGPALLPWATGGLGLAGIAVAGLGLFRE